MTPPSKAETAIASRPANARPKGSAWTATRPDATLDGPPPGSRVCGIRIDGDGSCPESIPCVIAERAPQSIVM
jgi:hypothetical protein